MSKSYAVARSTNEEKGIIVIEVTVNDDGGTEPVTTLEVPLAHKHIADMFEMTVQAGQMFGVLPIR